MKKNKGILINVLSIALGGFVFGYDIAMISGTTAQLEELFGLSKFESPSKTEMDLQLLRSIFSREFS